MLTDCLKRLKEKKITMIEEKLTYMLRRVNRLHSELGTQSHRQLIGVSAPNKAKVSKSYFTYLGNLKLDKVLASDFLDDLDMDSFKYNMRTD